MAAPVGILVWCLRTDLPNQFRLNAKACSNIQIIWKHFRGFIQLGLPKSSPDGNCESFCPSWFIQLLIVRIIPCARSLDAHQVGVGCARCVQAQREPGGLSYGCFEVPSNPKHPVLLSISDPRDVGVLSGGDLQRGDTLEECDLLGLDVEFPGLWLRWPPAALSAGAVET